MGRKPCCEKSSGLKRGPWTIDEDHKLINFILNNGIQCWRVIPKLAGLQRCGKSCRLRWINYLRPDLKRGALTEAEEDMIIQLHSRLGNRWSKIAAHFPGRTDNEIKNHWNTRIKKKLKSLGVDPLTHKPIEQQQENLYNDEENSTSVTKVENNMDMLSQDYHQVGYESQTTLNFSSRGLEKETELMAASNSNQIGGGNANMGLMMSHHERDSALNKLCLEFGGGEDFLESWIDSPFQWDAFNNSEEDFL